MSLSYALSQVPILAHGFLHGDWSLNGGLIWITTFMVGGLVLMVVALCVNPVPRSSKRPARTLTTRN